VGSALLVAVACVFGDPEAALARKDGPIRVAEVDEGLADPMTEFWHQVPSRSGLGGNLQGSLVMAESLSVIAQLEITVAQIFVGNCLLSRAAASTCFKNYLVE
jgi:hypothetical protein